MKNAWRPLAQHVALAQASVFALALTLSAESAMAYGPDWSAPVCGFAKVTRTSSTTITQNFGWAIKPQFGDNHWYEHEIVFYSPDFIRPTTDLQGRQTALRSNLPGVWPDSPETVAGDPTNVIEMTAITRRPDDLQSIAQRLAQNAVPLHYFITLSSLPNGTAATSAARVNSQETFPVSKSELEICVRFGGEKAPDCAKALERCYNAADPDYAWCQRPVDGRTYGQTDLEAPGGARWFSGVRKLPAGLPVKLTKLCQASCQPPTSEGIDCCTVFLPEMRKNGVSWETILHPIPTASVYHSWYLDPGCVRKPRCWKAGVSVGWR